MERPDEDPVPGAEVLFRRRSPGEEDHLSEEQLKVLKMESDVELLQETLTGMTEEEFKVFQEFLQRDKQTFSSDVDLIIRLHRADPRNAVLMLVEAWRMQSLDKTKNILKEMGKISLVRKLSDSRPRSKETEIDKLPTALIHKVASMAAARDHLSEILGALNQEEFQLFTWFLLFTLFQRGLRPFPSSSILSSKKEKLVDELLVRCGRQAVEVATEALTGISMSDLARRLSDGCPRGKGKQEVIWPELNDKVDQLESVIQKLMDKLAQLSLRELEVVKKKAMFEMRSKRQNLYSQSLYSQSLPFWFPAVIRDPFDLMVILVLAYGQQSEDKISDFLTPPICSPLRPGKSSSETEVDEKRSALIRRVATFSALRQLLVEILTELSDDELNEFTALLKIKVGRSIPQPSWNRSDRSAIVDLMMEELGLPSVDVTKQLLTELNRTDLLQRFPASPQHKENLSVEKPADASTEYFMIILMEILRHLSLMDLDRFCRLLQLTCFHRSIPGIQVDTLDMMDDLNQQVRLIVDRLGQKSLAVVREVFIDMDRRDLVEKLPKTSLKSEDFASRLPSETNEADVRKLLEVFMDLSDTQLEVFRRILQKRVWKRGFKLLLRHQDEMTERLNLAEVMVQLLQKQSLQVAMEILQEINRTDLQQKLSSSSSAPEESPSEPPEKTGNVEQEEASGWTKAEPTITNEDEVPTYSFSSAAGQFECSVSALRWVCKDKVDFKFQFCSWQGNMERMKTRGFTPAGPLLNITVISGKINEVFLPHWICIDEIPNLSENFSVLHMNDCGDVLEKVSTVTATHVGLMDPVFSPVAAMIKSKFGSKVNTKLLIYYQPLQPFLKLRVYLIPNDPALQQSVDKKESSFRFELIEKPRPDRFLKMQKKFTLKASLETAEIQPQKLTFRYDGSVPNFYEVYIGNPNRTFDLTLLYAESENKEQILDPVWTCQIRRDDYPKSGPAEASASSGGAAVLSSSNAGRGSAGAAAAASGDFVDKHRDQLIQRVKNLGPIMDELLQKEVLHPETYNDIRSLRTAESQMREIFIHLGAGDECKNIFFSILQKNERFLVSDLQKED